ncbi:Retrovirus Polyprotein [Phytophthora megakarya]|uniref:Retrovirus Polyprotein n=1 Tax=Phytophthora megakarya TaxID=4795 RepID=A0A225VUP8_9STRA|nr:Retrovirus Polyprotein [Phytophthora megakarya]
MLRCYKWSISHSEKISPLTPNGIQPQVNKVEAIKQFSEPTNKKELCRFLGMISYYREMVPNKSASTARLNRLASNYVPFTWAPEDTIGICNIKEALVRNGWLAFLTTLAPFTCLRTQGKRNFVCFCRYLTDTQAAYSPMEWELLSVVEILKEYRTMPLGFPIVIYTDHKNLLFPQETSLRIKRWKLLLNEY